MKRAGKLTILMTTGLLLSACTAFHTPEYQAMPSRDSIVAGGETTVGANENVYSVAHKNGVSMREIIVLNDLKPPFALRVGQTLLLPAKDGQPGYTAGGTMAPTPSGAPLGPIEAMPLDAPSYSAGAISSAPLDAPQILPKNDVVTSSEPPPIDKPLTLGPAKPVTTTVAPKSGDKMILTEMKPSEKPTAPVEVASKEDKEDREAAIASAPAFAWPLQGPILSGYGPKDHGLNNDGINIGGPKKAPVSASAGGTVVYAGNEMKGFGNLVLIRHEGGWVTAYAHLDRVMVSRDSIVAPGDMIGTVGTTGGVSSPQLHFETRLDGKAVDPQSVIKKRG